MIPKCFKALHKPSFSTVSVTKSADALTGSDAFPIATAQSENLGDLIQGSHILKIDSFLIRKE